MLLAPGLSVGLVALETNVARGTPFRISFARSVTAPLRAVLVAGALLLATAVAVQAADPADQVRANAIYKDAKDRFDSGDFQRAFELSSEAERLFPHPAITLMKARSLRKLGRLREAAEAFKKADSPQLPKPLVRPLADERALLADEMRIKGELVIEIQPANAVVSVDGDTQKGGFTKWLLAGKHRVEAVAPEFKPVVRTVELTPGETVRVKLDLQKQGGTLMVVAEGGLKGVDVLVDGKLLDIPEANRLGDRSPPLPMAIGKHEVICARGALRVSRIVQIDIDAVVDARCEGIAPPTVSATKAAGWGGVAVGAGLMGYGAWGLSSYYLVDKQDARGVETSNKAWLGTVYTVGGIAAGVASYLFLVRDHGPAQTASATDPVAPDVRSALAKSGTR